MSETHTDNGTGHVESTGNDGAHDAHGVAAVMHGKGRPLDRKADRRMSALDDIAACQAELDQLHAERADIDLRIAQVKAERDNVKKEVEWMDKQARLRGKAAERAAAAKKQAAQAKGRK